MRPTRALVFATLALASSVLFLAVFTAPAQTTPPTVIHVDDDAAAGGNGSAQSPYNTLADALAAARDTSAAVVIKVRPGDYAVGSTLVVDRPLALRGSSVLTRDAVGWPTGEVAAGTETRIHGTASLGTQPLIRVGRADAAVIGDVEIRGFVFQAVSASAGLEVLLTRVQDYTVADNAFRAPAFLGLQSVASSGHVTGNYFSGPGTGAALTGGFAASPSNVTFSNNRSVANTIGGLLLNGASINIPEHGDQLDAIVRDNDLSNNTLSQGFGFRAFILRRDLGAPGDTQSTGHIRAQLRGNRIAGNLIGINVDAGFPYRQVGTTCDPRVFSGSIDLELRGNTVTNSVLAPALMTFTRNTAALAPGTLSQWQYLHGAAFTITDPDGTLADAWIDHPERDPFLGPCFGDATNELLNNTLTYNGAVLANGRNF
jgi:hypothetical protein